MNQSFSPSQANTSQPQSILIVLHGAIGDVVRALPLAVRIKKAWPETKIIWGIEPLASEILIGHPAVDEIIIFRRSGGYKAFREYLSEIKLRKVDLVLDLQRHLKSGFISYSSKAKRRLGFNSANSKELNFLFNNERIAKYSNTFPKILHYQVFGDQLGLPPLEPLDAGFSFSRQTIDGAEEVLRAACLVSEAPLPDPGRRVAILLGGSWPSKRWTADLYAKLAMLIVSQLNALPILCGGRGDEQLAEDIIKRLQIAEYANVVGRTSLRELAYLLTQVKSVVGMDSGPMHISAAVGTPVVSLWGPTDPRRTGPYGSEAFTIQSAIGCSPCWKRECPGLQSLCLTSIPPEAIMQRLSEIHNKS